LFVSHLNPPLSTLSVSRLVATAQGEFALTTSQLREEKNKQQALCQ